MTPAVPQSQPDTTRPKRLRGRLDAVLCMAVLCASCASVGPTAHRMSPAQVDALSASTNKVTVVGRQGAPLGAAAGQQIVSQLKAEGDAALMSRHLAVMSRSSDVVLYRGNTTRLLIDGPQTFAAMFAAIVHDVGGFYLLARASEFPGLLDDGLNDDDIEGEIALSRAVLQVLAVPAPVTEGIEAFWAGYLALPPASLGDTLLLAAELSPVPRPLNRLAGRSVGELAASLDMAVGEETLQGILAESQEEVASLLEVLNF